MTREEALTTAVACANEIRGSGPADAVYTDRVAAVERFAQFLLEEPAAGSAAEATSPSALPMGFGPIGGADECPT